MKETRLMVKTDDTLNERYKKVKVAFDEFRGVLVDFQTMNPDDKILVGLTLGNLFNEIKSASNTIKERRKK
jgi:hypothetical protein